MLLILDVDGVLTDGKKYYDSTGRAVLKTFCDRDFTAIKKFKAAGWNVIFLSGDSNVNEAIAKNRNIPFYCNRINGEMINKVNFLDRLCKEYKTDINNTVYVGDDIFDIDLLKAVKWAFCPSNADADVKKIAINLNAKSGECCIAEIYQFLSNANMVKLVTVEQIELLDRNERF
jgi:3-deoxy-D-manno-octulosonate 8-phosphate phosphatase (KDO 8-P phosphatase)